MHTIRAIALAVSIATSTFAAPAQATTSDPLQAVYVIPGVRDAGTLGVATIVYCTNFSGNTENLQIATLNFDGSVISNVGPVSISNLSTKAAATHGTALYPADFFLSTGITISRGVMVVFATNPTIVCTAMMVDSGATSPIGIHLHAIRFNEWPGGQE